MSDKVVKRLQRRCWRALVIYTDLAEACCSILIGSEAGGLTPKESESLAVLRRAEAAAEAEYLSSRRELTAALSIKVVAADQSAWLASNAKNSVRQPSPHLKA